MFTNNPPALVAQISLASTPQPSTLVGILWIFLHIFCKYWLQNLLTSDCSWKNAFVSKDWGNSCKGLKDYNRLTRSHTQHITKINNVLLEGLDVCQLLNEHETPLGCLTGCLKRLCKQTHSDGEMEFLRWFLFCNHVPGLGISQGPRASWKLCRS